MLIQLGKPFMLFEFTGGFVLSNAFRIVFLNLLKCSTALLALVSFGDIYATRMWGMSLQGERSGVFTASHERN